MFRKLARGIATQSKLNPSRSNAVPWVLIGGLFVLGPGYYFIKPIIEPKKSNQKIEFADAKEIEIQKSTSNIQGIPGVPFVQYVLIGGGTASYAALEAIREKEPNAKVLLISEELNVPYQRPPLSKELWTQPKNIQNLTYIDWQNREANLFYLPKTSFHNVSIPKLNSQLSTKTSKIFFLGNTRVEEIDPEKQTIHFSGGIVQYGKVLIATGGQPRSLDFMHGLSSSLQKKVTTFRTIDDFQRLEKLCTEEKTIAVIGGGFLGTELAAGLSHRSSNGVKVIQLFPEEGNMSQVLPTYLTKWTTSKLMKEGVVVKPKTKVTSVEEANDQIKLNLSTGDSIVVDHIVVAAGLQPNTAIAIQSGLEVDPVRDGIIVNAELEARTNIFAAGDVSSYHDIALGRRRVEHYDHSVNSGRVAGLNMTGSQKAYTHQSMFWSNIGNDVSFEAVGLIESKMPTVSIWSKTRESNGEYNKGVVYYLKDKVVVGVLLWNLPGQVIIY